MNSKRNKGFTLIELLVVIAIIGLLSSVVLANLNTARLRAKDAAIKAEMSQLRIIMEQEFNDTGSYANLQWGWWFPQNNCASFGGGGFVISVRSICQNIVSLAGNTSDQGATAAFYMGNGVNGATRYAIMAWLPGVKRWVCVGSSGTSEGPANWGSLGCYSNP